MARNEHYESSALLYRESEVKRERVAQTFEALRDKLSAGQMLDRFLDYSRHNGGADFVRKLTGQVKNNPLPVALVGTGLAWLIFARGDSHSRGHAFRNARSDETTDSLKDTGSSALKAGRETLHDATAAVSGLTSSVVDTASSAADAVASAATRAGNAYEHGASAVSEKVGAFSAQGSRAGAAITDLVREQPLLLGAVGLALGAIFGAVMPSTRTEDELMGETKESLKSDIKRAAGEQIDRAAAAGKTVVDKVTQEDKDQNFTAGSTAHGNNRGDKVAAVAGAAAEAVKSGIKSQTPGGGTSAANPGPSADSKSFQRRLAEVQSGTTEAAIQKGTRDDTDDTVSQDRKQPEIWTKASRGTE
jgi:hypothetical protein